MNTTQLAHEIARRSKTTRTPLTRRQATQALDLLLDVMGETLAQPDGRVQLRHLLTLEVEQGISNGGTLRSGSDGAIRHITAGKTYYRLRCRPSRTLTRRLQQIRS